MCCNDDIINKTINVFSKSHGLTLTHQTMVSERLQFLDLNLHFDKDPVCWKYQPCSKKAVLHFLSAHSKLVKGSIASSLMKASLDKSCKHTIGESFFDQVRRLELAGYPKCFLEEVAETLVSKVKKINGEEAAAQRKKTRPVVIPYVPRLSHNLKRVAAYFEVPVVFSAPSKLSSLCPRVNNKK